MLWDIPEDKEIEQFVNHILGAYLAINLCSQAFPSEFIDDSKYSKSSAIGGSFYHEIIAPDMVLMFRS